MSKISSIHIKPVLNNSEEHNTREIIPDYVLKESIVSNINIVVEKIEERRNAIEKLYLEKVKQKIQGKMTPIREAVIVLDQPSFLDENGKHTTKALQEKLAKLATELKKKFKIECFQIHAHFDEGKKGDSPTPFFQRNLHAHMVFDWQDKATGKMISLKKKDMIEIQTLTAEILGLERGKFFSKSERLEHYEYREKMEQLDKRYQDKQLQLEEELSLKKQKLQMLKSSCTQLKEKKSSLKTRLESFKVNSKAESTQKSIQDLQSKKKSLETTLMNLSTKSKELKPHFYQTQKESNDIITTSQSMETEFKNLEMQLNDKIENYNLLKNQFFQSQPSISEFLKNQTSQINQYFRSLNPPSQ